MSSCCAWKALRRALEPGPMVHLHVGTLEQTHAWIIVATVNVLKSHPKRFSILEEGDLGARTLFKSLQILLQAILFLVVEMRLEFDQRLVFECGWKIVDVFLLRQLYETANYIPLGISWTVTFPTTVVELGSFSASNAVSEFVKAKRRLEVNLRGSVKLWDAPEGLHSFGPNQLSLLHLQASQPP